MFWIWKGDSKVTAATVSAPDWLRLLLTTRRCIKRLTNAASLHCAHLNLATQYLGNHKCYFEEEIYSVCVLGKKNYAVEISIGLMLLLFRVGSPATHTLACKF